MSKDVMSKIRAGDVWKNLERVLSDHRIERPDYEVFDERPHPRLHVRYHGVERDFRFSGTPGNRRTPKFEADKLRRILRAQVFLAEWRVAHPKYRVARWRCVPAGANPDGVRA